MNYDETMKKANSQAKYFDVIQRISGCYILLINKKIKTTIHHSFTVT